MISNGLYITDSILFLNSADTKEVQAAILSFITNKESQYKCRFVSGSFRERDYGVTEYHAVFREK